MSRTTTALGIELGATQLRAVQLTTTGDREVAVTGYAAAARPAQVDLERAITQLIGALDPTPDAVVGLVESTEPSRISVELATVGLSTTGLNDTALIDFVEAALRAKGPDAIEGGFVDCPIPPGLLAAYPGLRLDDLAPSVGAAMARLGRGFTAEPALDVWTPGEEPATISNPADEVTAVIDDAGLTQDTTLGGIAALGATAAGAAALDAAAAEPETPTPVEATAAPAPDIPDEPSATIDEPHTVDPISIDEPHTVDPISIDEPHTHDPETVTAAAPIDRAPVVAESNGRPGWLLPLLLAGLLLAAILAAIFLLGGGDEAADEPATVSSDTIDTPADGGDEAANGVAPVADDSAAAAAAEPTATPQPEPTATPEPEPEPTEAPAPEPTPEPTAAPEPTAEPEAEPEPTAEPEAEAEQNLPPLSELPERGAVYVASEDRLYLEGPVTAEEGAALEARAIEVLGAGRVVNNYIIRPDAPPVTEGNVRVEQAVLFETGSAVIAEDFFPTLELGVLVMNLNPQVTMVVEGHTDSVGSDPANLALSEQRAQAVVDYLVDRGIARERLIPVGLGETEPVASNDNEAGRQLNRRIEVDLLDLLGER